MGAQRFWGDGWRHLVASREFRARLYSNVINLDAPAQLEVIQLAGDPEDRGPFTMKKNNNWQWHLIKWIGNKKAL